jgi:DNA polymerase-3 subunit delta
MARASRQSAARKSSNGLTPAAFMALAAQHKLGPVYVLVGDDSAAVATALQQVRSTYLPPGTEEFNLEVLDAASDTVDAAQIIGAADTMAFMGGARVVFVKHVDNLSASELEPLGAYCEQLAAAERRDVVLLLLCDELDRRTRFARKLAERDAIVDCALTSISDVAAALRERYGKTITRDAAAVLQGLCDGDPHSARQELEKLTLFLGARDNVTLDDVLQVCMDTSMRNEWELADRLLQGDLGAALEVLQALRRNNLETLYQHAIIVTALSRLPAARAAMRDGSLFKRFAEFRLSYQHPARARIEQFLRRLSDRQSAVSLQYLAFMDIALKGSTLPGAILTDLACVLATA